MSFINFRVKLDNFAKVTQMESFDLLTEEGRRGYNNFLARPDIELLSSKFVNIHGTPGTVIKTSDGFKPAGDGEKSQLMCLVMYRIRKDKLRKSLED